MSSSTDIIDFYDLIYPGAAYRYWISDRRGKTCVNRLVNSGEDIFTRYNRIANLEYPHNHYISVNTYTLNNTNKPIKTDEISKIVIDLDDNDNPDATIQDARNLVELFSQMDYDIIPLKTGQKGIHLHLKLNTIQHPQIDLAIKSFFQKISDKLNITTMDMGVIADQTARITRLPGSYHTKTGNACIPIDIYSAETLEDMNPLDITKITFNTGDNTLEKAILRHVQSFKQYKNIQLQSKAYDLIDTINWDIMDKVFPALYEPGKSNGSCKYIVSCPFHSDNHPSAFYNDKVFHCSACNISMSVWKMLTEYAGYNSEDAMRLIKKFQ